MRSHLINNDNKINCLLLSVGGEDFLTAIGQHPNLRKLYLSGNWISKSFTFIYSYNLIPWIISTLGLYALT